MGDIMGLYNKMNKPEIDTNLLFDNLFEEVFPKIKDAIRERWKRGLKPDGNIIGIYASSSYAFQKNKQNSLAGIFKVDLTLTGALGKGLTLAFIDVAKYEIFSTDSKFTEIVQKYGEYNFNISDEEKTKLARDISIKITNQIIKNYYG